MKNHTSAWNLKFLWSSVVPISHKTGRPHPAKQSRVVRLPWLPGKPHQVTVSLVSRRDFCRVVYADMHVKLCRWLDAKEDWLVGVAWSGEVQKLEADDLGVLIQRNQKKFLVIWSCNTPLFLCTGFLGTNCPRIECSLFYSHFPFAACSPVQKNDFTKGSPSTHKDLRNYTWDKCYKDACASRRDFNEVVTWLGRG